MKSAVITGISGQDGAYLAQLLLEKGYKVYGTYRRTSSVNFWRIEELGIEKHPNLHLVEHDLQDLGSSIRLLQDSQATEVYNLAAQSFVGVSFDQPVLTAQITALGALNLLEAIRAVNPKIRFYQASTSEMFGASPPPQNEETPFSPRSPYGAAKVYSYWMTRNYREAYGMFAVNGILFNHESPRRGATFVTRKITRAVASIASGAAERLYLGNLDAIRDWGYAAEYVEGMWRMLQVDTPQDYVLATSTPTTVQQFLEYAFGSVGLNWRDHVEFDERYLRPTEVDSLIGDPTNAQVDLGWKASVGAEDLARLMVAHDLAELGSPRGHVVDQVTLPSWNASLELT